jgi:glutamyl-tRNA synthetase
MSTIVRFAPSPTGHVHIGNIRTAIFNWLFARHSGGKFLLRIEDTDLERSTRQAIDSLLKCMDWLGLDYDGEILYQTCQRENHVAAAESMISRNMAYRGIADANGQRPIFFRIPWCCEGMSTVRETGEAEHELHQDTPVIINAAGINFATVSKKGTPSPVSACLAGFRQLKLYKNGELLFELEKTIEEIQRGKSLTIESCDKMTFLRREVFYNDIIKGEMSKPLDSIKDLIIVRGDGSPVFHLANVVDDITQNVTHIIRGDDHVENTYRHILLFNALNRPAPQYAHLPMIVNSAGKPYSKRDGDAFVGDFRDNGFLPAALFNYLALLGWSPGDDREKMTKPEMISAFSLERVKSAPAQLDYAKLLNLNGQYLAEMSPADFATAAESIVQSYAWGRGIDPEYFAAVSKLMQCRTRQLSQATNWQYFFSDFFPVEEKAFTKQLKPEENRMALADFASELSSNTTITREWIHDTLDKIETRHNIPHGKFFQPVRLSISGLAGGAELDETILLLGQTRCVRRINSALEHCNIIFSNNQD